MAGELATAASGLTPPKQGSVTRDALTLLGGLAQERERQRELERRRRMEEMVLGLQERQVGVEERKNELAEQQMVQQQGQFEQEMAHKEATDWVQLDIAGKNADAQMVMGEASMINAVRPDKVRQADVAAAQRIAASVYGLSPQEVMAMGEGVAGWVEHQRQVELTRIRENAFGQSAQLEFLSRQYDAVGENLDRWQRAYDNAYTKLDAFMKDPGNQLVVTVPGPDGQMVEKLGSMLTPDELMYLAQEGAAKGTDLDVMREFNTIGQYLEQARTNYDNVMAQVAGMGVGAPVQPGNPRAGSLSGAAGVAAPAPLSVDQERVLSDLRNMAQKQPIEFATNWIPHYDQMAAQMPGTPNPVDLIMQELNMTRESYMQQVVVPAQEELMQVSQGGPGVVPAPMPTAPPSPMVLGPLSSQLQPASFRDFLGNRPTPVEPMPTPKDPTLHERGWEMREAEATLRDLARSTRSGVEGQSRPQRALEVANQLLQQGYPRKRLLKLLDYDVDLQRYVSDHTPNR